VEYNTVSNRNENSPLEDSPTLDPDDNNIHDSVDVLRHKKDQNEDVIFMKRPFTNSIDMSVNFIMNSPRISNSQSPSKWKLHDMSKI
jgi:hypothetical protein